VYPTNKDLWMAAAYFEKEHGKRENLESNIKKLLII
jgi:hypothetical protein